MASFDLASVLGRTAQGGYRTSASFFDAISQDPVLNRVVLIAELKGPRFLRARQLPVDWSEWNGTLSRHDAQVKATLKLPTWAGG